MAGLNGTELPLFFHWHPAVRVAFHHPPALAVPPSPSVTDGVEIVFTEAADVELAVPAALVAVERGGKAVEVVQANVRRGCFMRKTQG